MPPGIKISPDSRPSPMAFDLHCKGGHEFIFRQASGSFPAKPGIPLPEASRGVVKTYTRAGRFWIRARQKFSRSRGGTGQ
jgi:hypothetical protein